MRALIYQTLFVTVLWGLGMKFLFAYPAQKLAIGMVLFALAYGAFLALWRWFKSQRVNA
jgi:hypothetical protein